MPLFARLSCSRPEQQALSWARLQFSRLSWSDLLQGFKKERAQQPKKIEVGEKALFSAWFLAEPESIHKQRLKVVAAK